MGSGQMKTRLVLVTLMLLVFTEMSQCLTMSKVENGQDSLTTENTQASQGEASILLRQERMSQDRRCRFCCSCCDFQGCGICCRF
ncbi:hepcidin-1-like [Stegostoma tigrinum]|uniref:hepcidin-1-like n=1 Tax=Stegostoma tigrinum TaxID=3053191 RepID=UPI00286FFF80|nr:hepcidin-1-like [Stegostoma tigrinum]